MTGQERPAEPQSPASEFATALLAALVALGVRDLVVAPGSRSQALALAAAALERRGLARLHVRLDERDAAFFALGVARESGVPAAMITTSGTAVANAGPAILEAHHGGVPLLLLSADRPEELRGIRSNQTTAQAHLFPAFARLSVDAPAPLPGGEHAADAAELAAAAWDAATGRTAAGPPHPGPVQLNLAFREPLSGSAPDAEAAVARAGELLAGRSPRPIAPRPAPAEPEPLALAGDALTVVVAGAGAGAAAEQFAHDAGLPLLAEVVSGARFGRQAIANYAELIDDPALGGLIERVVVFGQPSLTRQVPALVLRDDVETIVVVSDAGERFNPGRRVAHFTAALSLDPTYDRGGMRGWLSAWVRRDRELQERRSTRHEPDLSLATEPGYRERNRYARAEVAAMREPVDRALLCETVWRATWPHDRLVLGASRLVRELDRIAPSRKLAVHSNRGLAGIDGTVATALGVAAVSQADPDPGRAAGVTRVLLGDLTLLHDVGGLLLGAGEARPRIQLVVGNDGGGSIFDGLEVAGSADRADFDRVMFTPQAVSLESLAAAYGWEYVLVSTRVELERVFTGPVAGPTIIEVPLPRGLA